VDNSCFLSSNSLHPSLCKFIVTAVFIAPPQTNPIDAQRISSERFKVIAVANTKITVVWDVVPCGPEEADRHFKGAYSLHRQDDYSSPCETSVNFYETTRRNIPEDRHQLLWLLHAHHVVCVHALHFFSILRTAFQLQCFSVSFDI
jgi:hypothetical protein